ncbi:MULTISPECIES: APC family permease [Pseudomonas]|jgi:amino acid transporter|uniref:APC family permease n=1 Tax=Pseudomonas sp. NFX71 TaxID=3399121 RepID=UPI003A8ABB0F
MTELTESLHEEAPIVSEKLKGNLGTYQIALLVIAAAAPLGAVLTAAPIGFQLGNGPGLAGTFLVAGFLMVCFSVGYGELIRAIPGAGAFYKYLSVVFGPRVGAGAAWVALASYLAITIALAIVSGYYTNLTLQTFGVDIGWTSWTLLLMALTSYLGRANIDFAAKILVPLVLAEFFMLFLLGISIFMDKGLAAFPVEAVSIDAITSPGLGVGMMVALAAFLGVESAALYAMEAKRPEKSIPGATRLAVALVAVAYFVIIWLIVGGIGVEAIKGEAASAQGELIINLFSTRLGGTTATLVSIMLCTSNFACLLSLHNAATRYVHVLAKDKHLPRVLSNIHAQKNSPANASLLVTVVVAVCIAVPSSLGYDAFVFLFPVTLALGTIGLIGLQAFISLAVVAHFKKVSSRKYLKVLVSPLVALAGLSVAVYLIYENYGLLTGSESAWVNGTPLLLVVLFFYGVIKGRSKNN